MGYEEAVRDLVKALGDKPDWSWAKSAMDRYNLGDRLVHGTWSEGYHVLGSPLVLLDTYLSVPRHWRWMYHLAAAIACHVVNGNPLLPDLKVRLRSPGRRASSTSSSACTGHRARTATERRRDR